MKYKIKKILASLLVVFVIVPLRLPDAISKNDPDTDFEALINKFIQEYLNLNPQTAVSLGFHQFDGKEADYSSNAIGNKIKWAEDYFNKLSEINPDVLNKSNYINYKILLSEIEKTLFNLKDKKAYSIDPGIYSDIIDVNIYISRDFAPIEDRIKSIIEIEKKAPEIFSNAKANLKEVLPKPFVEIAIDEARGNADFLSNDLVDALKDVKNESLMKQFNDVNKTAVKELKDYAEYLEKEKLPKSDDNFRLGKEFYKKMLEQEMITLSPEDILAMGLEKLKQEQKLFEETAKIIDPTKKAVDVFKEIQKDHPTAQSLLPDTRKNMESIRQFLVDNNIVTIPSEVRVLVQETPHYLRATTFASMDTPGPFEKSSQAYYYVTPVENSWGEKQKDEWLTAFNYYTTDIVTIHEAYPGHYIQYLHVNASDVSKLQKILTSYAFSEGWAHYSEQMLVEEGFPSGTDEVTAAKYHLAQLDESLLRYCRLCVSIMMHCNGMTVDEATKFFVDNCYYEEKPSHSEAMRGTSDPGYLYYTMGKLMLYKLRDDYKKQEGENYSLKKFHDTILNYGAPPIPLLREIILNDKNSWKEIL